MPSAPAPPAAPLSPLALAAPAFRCLACRRDGLASAAPDTHVLRCPYCGHAVPPRDGVFDFITDAPPQPTLGQSVFLTSLGARAYERVRESPAMWLATGQTFADEVRWYTDALALAPDARVLEVPCGHGNFTAAVARATPRGVVVGVDLSATMLGLAHKRLAREALDRVVLVRASALELPFGDETFDAVSDPGGLHLYPNVPRALSEMRRVLCDDGRVVGLTFLAGKSAPARVFDRALDRVFSARAFDFDELRELFENAGFADFEWHGRGVVGYFEARGA